jgi:hypothetical protein
LRLAVVARGYAGELEAGDALRQAARERPPDSAEAGNGDAGSGHGTTFRK